MGESLRRNIICIVSMYFSKILITEGKIVTLWWGSSTDTILIRKLKLTPPIIRHNTMHPLVLCTEKSTSLLWCSSKNSQSQSNHGKTSAKPKLRNSLQYTWPVLFIDMERKTEELLETGEDRITKCILKFGTEKGH